ncbi:hypothetical protein O4H61_01720 [Roseovarius aestuarii]|nr:hypothetical protein [Roseovarius aestuarii]
MAHIRQVMAEAVFASVTKAIPYAGIQTWTKCSTADTNTRAT